MNVINPFGNHEIVFCSSSIKNPVEARIILIGELHNDESDLIANARLIDKLMGERSILFLEGVRSMHEIKPAQLYKSPGLSQLAQSRLSFFGWDHYHHMAKDGSSCNGSEMPDEMICRGFNASSAEWTEYPRYAELIARDFPIRTSAMVKTLQGLTALQEKKKLADRAFLIAGRNHFVQSSPDPRHSLDLLYKTLDKLPAVVVNPLSDMRNGKTF